MSIKVEEGQFWTCTSTQRSGRVFRIMRVDETHAHILGLTTDTGEPIPSYLQRTGKIALRNMSPKYGYRPMEKR